LPARRGGTEGKTDSHMRNLPHLALTLISLPQLETLPTQTHIPNTDTPPHEPHQLAATCHAWNRTIHCLPHNTGTRCARTSLQKVMLSCCSLLPAKPHLLRTQPNMSLLLVAAPTLPPLCIPSCGFVCVLHHGNIPLIVAQSSDCNIKRWLQRQCNRQSLSAALAFPQHDTNAIALQPLHCSNTSGLCNSSCGLSRLAVAAAAAFSPGPGQHSDDMALMETRR
jgi:hypothetical protein